MPDQNPLEEPLRRLMDAVNAARPAILNKMGTIAVNFVHENFEKEGFQGAVFDAWAPRKEETKQTTGKPILTMSAHLRNATRYEVISNDAVALLNMMPYAGIHNSGGDIAHTGRQQILSFARSKGGGLRFGKTRTAKQRASIVAQNKATIGPFTVHMPRRQFIGDSPVLNTRITEMIVDEVNHFYKQKS